jgi:hypothetical protein
MEVRLMFDERSSRDESPKPIPLDELRLEVSRYLRETGVDPETVPFEVEHQQYIGTFDGEVKTITITVMKLDGSTYQWFPELPDAHRERRRRAKEAGDE